MPEFGGNHRLFAASFERCAEHLLTLSAAVDVSRVEECDPLLERRVHDARRARCVQAAPEVVATNADDRRLENAPADGRVSRSLTSTGYAKPVSPQQPEAVRLTRLARRVVGTPPDQGPAPEPAEPRRRGGCRPRRRRPAEDRATRAASTSSSVRTLVSAALIVLGIVALVAFLASIISIVLVVLVAIVFAEGIRPLVAELQRRRIPRPVGILIVYIAVLAFIAIMVLLLVQPIVSEASSLATNFPAYQKDFLNWFTGVENGSSTSTSTSPSRSARSSTPPGTSSSPSAARSSASSSTSSSCSWSAFSGW